VPSWSHRRDESEALVSVAQAASLLGVHPNTIRTWTDSGRLPAYRINIRGDRRFRRRDVERLLAEGPLTAPAEPMKTSDPVGRDHELTVLARLAQAGIGSSPVAVCRVAIDALRTQLAVPQVAIYLASRHGLHLETHAGYDTAPPATLSMDRLQAQSDAARPDGTVTDLRLPLRASGDLLGALVVRDPAGTTLQPHERTFLATVADALAVAVHNARLLGRARREVTRARALRGVTQELTGQLDLPVVLDDIVERTKTLFEADKAGLWLLGDGEHPFELAASRGIGEAFQASVRTLNLESPTVGVRAIVEKRVLVARRAGEDAFSGSMRETYAAEGIETACLVPLISHDRAVGLIGLYHTRDRDWPEEELTLAQSFADQAAVAITNAQLYRSVADQAARMRSIQDLSSRLNRLTDVRAIAEAIVAEASTLAAYHDIRIYEVDWDRRVCEPIAFTRTLLGELGDFVEKLRVDIGPGSFTGTVAESGEPMLINDALADERGLTIEGTDDIDESMLVVPMVYEGRAVGVVALSKLGTNQFSENDLQTMTIFAGYAAQAIVNARSYERLELQSAELARQLQSQRRLLEINQKLLTTLNQASVLELIADGLKEVVSYDNLSVYRTDHTKRVMVPVLTRERHADAVARYIIPFGRGLMGWVVENARPVLANDALNDPRAVQIPGTPPDPEALCVMPLISGDEVIGTLNIGRIGREEVYFSDADFELIQLFAGQASIALRNAEAHQVVSQRAETDELTGLGNHGAFQRYLAERMEGLDPARPDAPRIGLLMMDLDRFKAYNDRLGHPAGDALLHAIGGAIQGAARALDRVFRYGGDEFVLVLHDVDAADAAVVGDRIRRAVARLSAAEATPVTITVGAAAFPSDAGDKNALISAADTALYHGKQSGENRVVRFADVPSEMRDLRGTLDQLARAALQHPEEAGNMEHLVEHAALLGTPGDRAEEPQAGASVRDTLLAVSRSLESRDAATRGHADRVGRTARSVAERLGCSSDEAAAIELAARLHGLKEIGRDELSAVGSLRDVAEIVAGHRLLYEGQPLRRATDTVSLAAEVVAAANAYDELTSGHATGTRLRRERALERMRANRRGVRGEVIDALAWVVGPRVKPLPAGRRRSDTALEGAA
jgi:diguanylate cyclase (GGDEF)-like protein/excisionase family DNA binding protein